MTWMLLLKQWSVVSCRRRRKRELFARISALMLRLLKLHKSVGQLAHNSHASLTLLSKEEPT
jgi:hypothetical protein